MSWWGLCCYLTMFLMLNITYIGRLKNSGIRLMPLTHCLWFVIFMCHLHTAYNLYHRQLTHCTYCVIFIRHCDCLEFVLYVIGTLSISIICHWLSVYNVYLSYVRWTCLLFVPVICQVTPIYYLLTWYVTDTLSIISSLHTSVSIICNIHMSLPQIL